MASATNVNDEKFDPVYRQQSLNDLYRDPPQPQHYAPIADMTGPTMYGNSQQDSSAHGGGGEPESVTVARVEPSILMDNIDRGRRVAARTGNNVQTKGRQHKSAFKPRQTGANRPFAKLKDSATIAQRLSSVDTIQKIWGDEPRNWPIHDLSPVKSKQECHIAKQDYADLPRHAPLDWNTVLSQLVADLATLTNGQCQNARQAVLREIRKRLGRARHEREFMDAKDLRNAIRELRSRQTVLRPVTRSATKTVVLPVSLPRQQEHTANHAGNDGPQSQRSASASGGPGSQREAITESALGSGKIKQEGMLVQQPTSTFANMPLPTLGIVTELDKWECAVQAFKAKVLRANEEFHAEVSFSGNHAQNPIEIA